MVIDPLTGLCSTRGGGLRSRSRSTQGQPVSEPVRVTGPCAGRAPRLTGEAPVLTSANSSDPAGESPCTFAVTRTALPRRTTAAGAGGASFRASSLIGSLAKPGRHAATRANRCGSTASTVSPAVPLDVLV